MLAGKGSSVLDVINAFEKVTGENVPQIYIQERVTFQLPLPDVKKKLIVKWDGRQICFEDGLDLCNGIGKRK